MLPRFALTRVGAEKAAAAASPNLQAAVLIIVYAATAYLGFGRMPTGEEVQAAAGLLVLAAISYRRTWWTANSPTPPSDPAVPPAAQEPEAEDAR